MDFHFLYREVYTVDKLRLHLVTQLAVKLRQDQDLYSEVVMDLAGQYGSNDPNQPGPFSIKEYLL